MSSECTFRLPEPWTAPEVVEDVIVADGVEIHRSGLSTIASDGEEICGAAAELSGSATSRAWFELLERVSTLEAIREPRGRYAVVNNEGTHVRWLVQDELFPQSPAPTRWRYARSNGVALHVEWASACERALWELVERDRVLRAWYGATTPVRIELGDGGRLFAKTKSYDWRAYSFPCSDEDDLADDVEVVGVFGFPTNSESPFVLGFAGRSDLPSALTSALAEATQLLGFLWGEPIGDEAPVPTPTAMHHLETYQARGRHDVVRRWLDEGHRRFFVPTERQVKRESGGIGFVDLTPSWLEGSLRVAKAVSDAALPLVFGASPFGEHLPNELAFHPIP